jgi:hypothetical protein
MGVCLCVRDCVSTYVSVCACACVSALCVIKCPCLNCTRSLPLPSPSSFSFIPITYAHHPPLPLHMFRLSHNLRFPSRPIAPPLLMVPSAMLACLAVAFLTIPYNPPKHDDHHTYTQTCTHMNTHTYTHTYTYIYTHTNSHPHNRPSLDGHPHHARAPGRGLP